LIEVRDPLHVLGILLEFRRLLAKLFDPTQRGFGGSDARPGCLVIRLR
jgi:hypothetical protein